MPFIKKFETRWGDLDANKHLANVAYSELMTNTRTSYFRSVFFGDKFNEEKIAPVILSERIYFLKEVLPFEHVYVELENNGASKDFRFIEFAHSLFNKKGIMVAYGEVLTAWIDIETRKLITPPKLLLESFLTLNKDEKMRILTKEDIRYNKIPNKKIDIKHLK